MTNETRTVRNRHYIDMVVIIFLMFGFGYLPTFLTVTRMGMHMLGIFLGCIYAWTSQKMDWPSLLALIAMSFAGYGTLSEILASAFGHEVLWIVMFSMLVCYSIDNTGILPIISRKILSIKFARKGPWALAFVFMIAAAITGFLTINALTVILLLWKIFYDVADQLDLKPHDPYPTIVLIMIVIAGTTGSVIAPYTGFVLMSFGILDSVMPGITVNPLAYSVTVLIINIAIFIALILFFKYIARIKVNFKPIMINAEDLKMNSRQKIMLGLIVLLIVTMMVPNLLPEGNIFRAFFVDKLGSLGIMIGINIVLALITKDKQNFTNISQSFKEGISWGLFLMIATALTISTALASESTGVIEAIVHILNPILEGHSLFWLMTIIVAISVIATNLINDMATLSIITPIAIAFVAKAGGDPVVIVTLLAFTCMLGFFLPAASAMGAITHGNEWLTPKLIYKYESVMIVIIIVVTSLIGVPVANYIFGLL